MCLSIRHVCGTKVRGSSSSSRAVLNAKKNNPVQNQVISKQPAGTPCAQPWLWQLAVAGWRQLAVGSWQLAVGGGRWWLVVGGWRQLAVVGSWRLVAAGGWRRLVAGGRWRLVVGGWWQLAVDGSWRLAVGGPLGLSLRAVLSKKKKISFLKDAPVFVWSRPRALFCVEARGPTLGGCSASWSSLGLNTGIQDHVPHRTPV